MKKKIHKQSALSRKLKAQAGVQLPKAIGTDARVLELRGPRTNEVVTVPLMLLPAWKEFHKVEPVQYDERRELLIVKRLEKS